MKCKPLFSFIFCGFLLLFCCFKTFSQLSFSKTVSQEKTLKQLADSVEINPNNQIANEHYLGALNINDPLIQLQYNKWMRLFPKSAVIPFELGKFYQEHSDLRSEELLLRAVNINPKLTEAWISLSSLASFKGETNKAIAYIQRATILEPQNVDYAFKYVYLQKDGPAAVYDSLMLNLIHHFPKSEKSAEALCQLASLPYNYYEKTAYYELLYKMFNVQQVSWFKVGMRDYYNYLINTAPDKAFDLALKMVVESNINRGYWKQKLIVARQFVEVNKLLDINKPVQAAEILKHVDLQNSKRDGIMIDAEETLVLYKARATFADNKFKQAYDSLSMYYSKTPTAKIRETLINYGKKINKDSTRVDSDISAIRNRNASKQMDFTLKNYSDNKNVSLSDYRGKLVLLTFWFPGCGPCRKEFLYFEAAIKHFGNSNIAYLGINVSPSQDDDVLPLMKNKGYTFVPLKINNEKKIGILPPINGAPVNFLIDQNGRIVFSDFQIDEKNEPSLYLMIKEMLSMSPAILKGDERIKSADNGRIDNHVFK
jgi:thiol-disulfide isomerase/thioredoxin